MVVVMMLVVVVVVPADLAFPAPGFSTCWGAAELLLTPLVLLLRLAVVTDPATAPFLPASGAPEKAVTPLLPKAGAETTATPLLPEAGATELAATPLLPGVGAAAAELAATPLLPDAPLLPDVGAGGAGLVRSAWMRWPAEGSVSDTVTCRLAYACMHMNKRRGGVRGRSDYVSLIDSHGHCACMRKPVVWPLCC